MKVLVQKNALTKTARKKKYIENKRNKSLYKKGKKYNFNLGDVNPKKLSRIKSVYA